MKKISEFIPDVSDYYLLSESGEVINQKNNRKLKPDNKHCYRLMLKSGKAKGFSLKTLMREVYDTNFYYDNTTSLEGELWRYVPNTNELYMCSSKGRIKSLRGIEAIIMKPALTKKGYLRLQIALPDGSLVNKFIHTLVCETWFPDKPLDEKHCCHHIKSKLINDIESLQVLTKEEHIKVHQTLNNAE